MWSNNAVSPDGTMYYISAYEVNTNEPPRTLPTGEKLPSLVPMFREKGKISDKLKNDLLLTRDNKAFDSYGPAMDFIMASNLRFDMKSSNGQTMFIETPITDKGLWEKYDMPREEVEQMAKDYERDKRRLTELVNEAKRIMDFNKSYNANMLLPVETKMSELQTQMQKYSGVAGFFRKMFKHKDYVTTKFGLEESKRQMAKTEARQAEMDQQYNANQLRYPQIKEEFDTVKSALEQNVDGAEATRCVEFMKQVEKIRERLEQKDNSDNNDR